jgi:cytochrome c oxidase cbb3-type subunit 3
MQSILINKKLLLKSVFIFSFLLTSLPVFPQAEEASGSLTGPEILLLVIIGLVLLVAVLVLIVAIYLVNIVKLILMDEKKRQAAEAGLEVVKDEEKRASWFKKLMAKATDAVPVTEEDTVLLDHDYDGIKELDNHLPPWWKWLFYFTIAWSFVYLLVYHVFGVFPLMEEEYESEMEAARVAKEERMQLVGNNIDENTVEFSEDPGHLANGEGIFNRECAACHRKDGGGQIGPNLTDEYWIHGGSINDLFVTIKYGVPQKGMISWQSKLSPTDMRDVASYILTMKGSNPPNPKQPEGELYVPEEAPADDLDTAADSLRVAMK